MVQGRLPVSQRHAIITPRLKKPGLDAADMANYRPVSNVSFASKLVERAVAISQQAVSKHYSTETAILRVWSDIMMAADQQMALLCR